MKTFVSSDYSDNEIEYKFVFDDEPYCEHCYKMEPYEILIQPAKEDEWQPPYCIYCTESNGVKIPKKLLGEAKEKTRQMRIEYYKEKLRELEDDK
jgi:hypothetical protein